MTSSLMHGDMPASLANRQARAALRVCVRRGTVSLHDLLSDPPVCIHDLTLHDVLRWRVAERRPSRDHRLGAAALRDGINLLVPVGQASTRSKELAAEHGDFHLRRPKASA